MQSKLGMRERKRKKKKKKKGLGMSTLTRDMFLGSITMWQIIIGL